MWQAAVGLLGSLGSSAYGVNSAQSMQRENIAWQREQAQSRYQWMTEDMRKAGLNPMLASGASPAGLAGAAQSASVHDAGSAAASGFQAAASGRMAATQEAVGKAQADNLAANSAKAKAEQIEIETRTQSGLYQSMAALNGATAAQREALIPHIQAQVQAELAKAAETYQRIQNLQEEIAGIRENVRTQRSQQASNYAQAELADKTSLLREEETKYKAQEALLTGIQAQIQQEGIITRIFGTEGTIPDIFRRFRKDNKSRGGSFTERFFSGFGTVPDSLPRGGSSRNPNR